MSSLCILPCGAKKIWDVDPQAGPTAAKHVYKSALHKACRRYAETFAERWVILSAKHGFLLPDDIVPGQYDVGFQHKDRDVVTAERLKEQMVHKQLDVYTDVIVLGGKKFVKVLSPLFDSSYTVRYPLGDCKGIGYMMQRLNQAVESGKF